MRPNSLAFRLFASAAAWTLVVLPVTAFLLLSLYRQAVERNFDARLNVYLTSLVASTTAEGAKTPTAPANLGEPAFTHSLLRLVLADQDARRRAAALHLGLAPRSATEAAEPRGRRPRPDPDATRLCAGSGGPAPARRRARDQARRRSIHSLFLCRCRRRGRDRARPRRVPHDADRGTRRARARSRGGDLFQVRFGLAPLRAIRHDLAAIRSGDAERLEGELPAEIRPLQQELNALIQSNREIVDRARTHVGNLAHALKTPLSVIYQRSAGEGRPARRQGHRAGGDHAQPDHPSSRPGAGRGALGRDRRHHRRRSACSRGSSGRSTASMRSRALELDVAFGSWAQVPGREAGLRGDGRQPARQCLQMGEVPRVGDRSARRAAPASASR